MSEALMRLLGVRDVEYKIQEAFLSFDMSTGRIIRTAGQSMGAWRFQTPISVCNAMRCDAFAMRMHIALPALASLTQTRMRVHVPVRPRAAEDMGKAALAEACFGLCASHKPIDTAFPMRDVTEAKLFSLFDGIREGGTAIYFASKTMASSASAAHGGSGGATTPLVGPSADGRSVRVGGSLLHEYLARAWLLPPSAAVALPWQEACGLPLGSGYPFTVTCVGPAGATPVRFEDHPWEAVVAAGRASPPRTLAVPLPSGGVARVHVQFGWCPPGDDDASGIWLHRHPRLVAILPLPLALDGAKLGGGRVCRATALVESGGPSGFARAYDDLAALCGGRFPLARHELARLSKAHMRAVMGERLMAMATCHEVTYAEGKEKFLKDDVFKAVTPALRYEAADFALHHPPPELAPQVAAAAQARQRGGAAARAAGEEMRAARAAADAGDRSALAALRLRREGLDPAAVIAPGAPPPAAPPPRRSYPRPRDPFKYGEDDAAEQEAALAAAAAAARKRAAPSKPKSAPAAKRAAPGGAGAGASAGGSAAAAAAAAKAEAEVKRLKAVLRDARRVADAERNDFPLLHAQLSRDALVARHEKFAREMRDVLRE
jgi:hypothetical protein